MPLRLNVGYVSEHAFVDHLLGELVELAVAALQADLENLLGMLRHLRPHHVRLFGLEHEALLAEDVLAGVEGVLGDAVMLEQRDGDDDGFDVLVGEQLAIILVFRRIGADDGRDLVHFLGIEIADGGAMPVVDFGEVLRADSRRDRRFR